MAALVAGCLPMQMPLCLVETARQKNVPRFNVLTFLQHSLILSMFVFKSIHNFKKG